MTEPVSSSTEKTAGRKMATDRAVAFLKLLGHQGRLEIVCLLVDGGRTVGEIAQLLDMSQSAVSQQLMRLRMEKLVVGQREGKSIRYVLGRPETLPVFQAVRSAFHVSEDIEDKGN